MIFLTRHEPRMCHYVVALVCFLLMSWLIVTKIAEKSNVANTEIELNIIDRNNVVSKVNLSEIGAKKSGKGVDKKKIKHHVPQFMLDLYENGKKKKGANYTAPDVVRSLIPRSAGPFCESDVVQEGGDKHLLVFDVPSSNDDEAFLNAELRVFTLVETGTRALTGVERIVKLSCFNENTKEFVPFQEVHVYHTNNTWLTFNLTSPVFDLLHQNTLNKTLKIIISIKAFISHMQITSGHLKLSLMPINNEFEHDYPILLLSYISKTDFSKKGASHIKKRSVEDEYEEDTNVLWDDDLQSKQQLRKMKRMRNTCRRKPLYVDFAEIHYDEWIVQPRGYEAFQCQGKCFYPVADHLSPTKHAVIQILLHSVAPTRVPRPCCVPTKLTSISVLYVDDAGVVTYRYAYNDMVAAECGCR